MNQQLSPSPAWLFSYAVLVLLVAASSFFVVSLPEFASRTDVLAPAVTADLVLFLPALFYFLVIRKYRWSVFSLIPVTGFALALAYFIIPPYGQTYLHLINQGMALLEVFTVVYTLIRIRAVVKNFRQAPAELLGFEEKLHYSMEQVLGKIAALRLLSSELSLFYYCFFAWKKPVEAGPGQLSFTYHRNNGHAAVMITLAFVVLIEALVVHLLLMDWNEWVAWILTAGSIYTLLFLFADVAAAAKKPFLLDSHDLYLRLAMRWQVRIPLQQIEKVERLKASDELEKDVAKLSLLGDPVLLIVLKNPVEVKGIYGLKKKAWKIAVGVDEKERLEEALRGRLGE